jgi:hypothetical protein
VRCLSCSGLEANRLDQCVKVIDDAVIEAVELRCTENLVRADDVMESSKLTR